MEIRRDADGATDLWKDLDEIVAHLPVGIYVCDAPEGIIRLYNRRAAELWGREPAIGDLDSRFCGSLRLFRADGTPLPHAETPMAQVLRSGTTEPREDEVVIERSDGSRRRVRVSIRPLLSEDGAVVAAVNAFQDVTDEAQAEEALRISESRYRAIVDLQPEMLCRFLSDGTMTFANAMYCRFFGRDPDELLGSRYHPVVHPDDVERVQHELLELSPANRTIVIENRVLRADGAIRWTRWTNHAIYDDAGHLVEYQSTGRDVTEEKLAEEAAARLAAIVSGAEDAIVSKNLEGTITSWNRGAESLFGFSAEEAVGRSITLIVPPDRLPEEAEILARISRGELISSFETERMRKDGTRVQVSVSISPVRDASGTVIGASKIARDISERLRAERRLQSTVANLEALYRLADLMGRAKTRSEVCEAAVEAVLAVAAADRASILLFDPAGVMRFVAWRGLSDAYRAAVDGHSPWVRETKDPAPIVVDDVQEDERMAELRDTFSSEGIRSLGFVPLTYQGRLLGKFMVYYDRRHAFSSEELRLATTIAHHVGFGLSRVDAEAAIDELLGREREARREADAARHEAELANQAKDEFLAMLAHELRNPLSVIANSITVIENAGALQSGPRRAGQMIRRQTEHLSRLLDDLLDVARITSGRFELDREPTDLREAITVAVESQRHRIQSKQQRVSVSAPEEAVIVDGDPVRLQQVLGNLVNNAMKYTPGGGAIDVSVEVDGLDAVVRVRDDGAGIPLDKLEAVFEPFSQANPTLARTEGGLGLGLTLVRRVVELHGGAVRAVSDGLGRGTELVVRLPVVSRPVEVAPARTGDVSVTPRRILVIEDHEDGREILMTTLRYYGHDVFGAGTGREGIELAVERSPDVVLVDIGLPDVDGYRVGRELRERMGRRVRLVALTGYSQPKDREQSEAAGFDAHLVKPVDPPKLAETLERLTQMTSA